MGVMFDSHDLEAMLIVGDPEITPFSFAPSYYETKRDGAVVSDVLMAPATVAFTVVVTGEAGERRDKLSTLAMWLNVDEPKQLVLPDTPGRYYMAIPDGELKLTRCVDGEIGQLTFTITEPASYGPEREVTVPSGGSVTFVVDGTYPTAPVITAAAVRDNSSQVWGLKLDNADFVHIATGNASARNIVLDCGARTLTVQTAVALPTLDSDWLVFEPGEHTLVMDKGTGAATVKYRERWI